MIGESAQLGFRTRAFMQIAAGVVMILMAANLLGVGATLATTASTSTGPEQGD